MKHAIHIALFSILIVALSCQRETHFISDPEYRDLVAQNFLEQKELAKNRSDRLFSVFNNDLSLQENEALKFLYAFMPLSDLADYNGEFFLSMVQSSIEARETMPWGKDIPEDIFRHFVLPYRVNNENLDTARQVFYRLLKNRVKGLPMEKAILEVNHWCHEHVTYKGADIRTSAPLATLRTGTGRCGEESTLLVTALRAVAIPARQVYTPRWAHSDDNHAWVEAWANGKWHFLGGCEPSPQLNQGWFAELARRAMFLHTKAFGFYTGPEEILHQKKHYAELNVLNRYADTKTICVHVKNESGLPIKKANVDFGLYNYAEFFPLASIETGSDGYCHFTTGLGDLIITASKNGMHNLKKVSVNTTDTLSLTLSNKNNAFQYQEINLFPPVAKTPRPLSSEGMDACKQRLSFEDSLRMVYERTFISKGKTFEIANKLNLAPNKVWDFIYISRGNWLEIVRYLEYTNGNRNSLTLLENIADKDLRDTPAAILIDHLENFVLNIHDSNPEEYLGKYILSPRIKNEIIVPYRSYFQKVFDEGFKNDCQSDYQVLVDWIDQNLVIDNENQYYDLPITPIGVFELKRANTESRNIFFVAVCRSFGIASRFDMANKIPQVYKNGLWHDIFFSNENRQARSATISLKLEKDPGFEPEYFIHFTLARIKESGFETLEFDYNRKWSDFHDTIHLFPGQYMLTTGNRLASGEILSTLSFYDIQAKSHQVIPISVRSREYTIEKIANNHLDEIYNIITGDEIIFPDDEPFVALFIDPDMEPTEHVFADLQKRIDDFNKINALFYFILPDMQRLTAFSQNTYKNLPLRSVFCLDKEKALLKLSTILQNDFVNDLPVILIYRKQGEIINYTSGYRLGLPDDVLNILKKLN